MSGFNISVTEAKDSKDSNYQDAFMRCECEDCGNVMGPIYLVQASYSSPVRDYYGGTNLLTAHVTAEAIGPCVDQAVQLFRMLSPMIDAAEADWNRREEERIAAEEAEEHSDPLDTVQES